MVEALIAASDSPLVVLVRHGETEWSRSGRHTSTTEVRLTEIGREQARRIGEAVHGHAFARVLSSPRLRARETAAAAGFADPVIDEDLTEWDYGPIEGKTTAAISAEVGHPWDIWVATPPDPVPGETVRDVGARADAVIRRLRHAADVEGGDTLVFAHAHLLRVLAARWVGLPARDGARLTLGTGSIGQLGFERGTPVIAQWNMCP